MANASRNKKIAYGMVLLQSLVFGFGDPVSKIAYQAMPVYSLLTARFLIAFLVLMAVAGRQIVKGLRESSWKDWILPAFCTALSYLCGNVALQYTEATSVAFLRSLAIVITPFLALSFYRRRISKMTLLLAGFVTVGLYLLCVKGGMSGFGLGEIMALLAAAFMAGSLVFGEESLQRVDPIMLTAMQCGISVVIDAGAGFLFDGGLDYHRVTVIPFLIVLYLAVVCTVLGYWLQNRALTAISPAEVALWQCICPVLTAAFSFVLLGEALSLLGMVGAAIIIISVAMETKLQASEETKNTGES